MNSLIEPAFYVCAVYLIAACVKQANITNPGTSNTVKACLATIIIGATLQLFVAYYDLLTLPGMAVSCLISVGLGTMIFYDRRERRSVRSRDNKHHGYT
jgi:hypothetical protein